jgi:hypothetical protein
LFDSAEAGGYPCLAGSDGLAVASAVGAFGQGPAVAFDFTNVGFAFVGVGSDRIDGGAGGTQMDVAVAEALAECIEPLVILGADVLALPKPGPQVLSDLVVAVRPDSAKSSPDQRRTYSAMSR